MVEIVVRHRVGGRFNNVMEAGGAPFLVNAGNFARAFPLRVEYMTKIYGRDDFSERHPLGGASRFCSDPNSHDVSLARVHVGWLLFGANNSVIHDLLIFVLYGK